MSSSNASYTHFRLSEKYFKNRAVKGRLPNLHDQSIIDLSRPSLQDEDEGLASRLVGSGAGSQEWVEKGKGKGSGRAAGDDSERVEKGRITGRLPRVIGGLRELSPSS